MDYIEFKEKFKSAMKSFIDIDLNESQCQNFYDYMTLLLEKNKVMNLTAIDDPDEVIIKHFVDSCMVCKFVDFSDKEILDIGTGAGFPGIPLAIICDKSKLTLTDTLGKRINFLSEVQKKLQLNNIRLFKSRAEDFANEKMHRENYDIVLARAVANLTTLSEYCLPCVKLNGKFLSFKLNDCDQELEDAKKAIEVLGGTFHVKHSYNLIKDEPKRCILEINKIKATPKQYPRKAGTPSKQPL